MKKEEYFNDLNHVHKDEKIISMELYAKNNRVPILQEAGLDFIMGIIKITNAKRILEIGSAIGYSAIRFALIHQDLKIDTIERDEEMIHQAIENIKSFQLESRIQLIAGDALDVELPVENQYDLLFIDAAKGQYQKFFEKYTPYLKPGGVVVTDNLIFHDLIFEDHIENKNKRQLVQKIKNYNEWLKNNQKYQTHFFNIGDGIAVSIKK